LEGRNGVISRLQKARVEADMQMGGDADECRLIRVDSFPDPTLVYEKEVLRRGR
jgi:hypothetical protein